MRRGAWLAVLVAIASRSPLHAETRHTLPMPDGLYSDGGSCGAAVVKQDHKFPELSVRDVVGDLCFLKSVIPEGAGYRFRSSCSEGNGSFAHGRHLPLVAGSYRTRTGPCGALAYGDHPNAPDLGGMFGGPAFGGDFCTVKRVARSGDRLGFEATCIPTKDGAAMRIRAPTAIFLHSPEAFDFQGRRYDLCRRTKY